MGKYRGPWTFRRSHSGTLNVVVDAQGKNIASYVPPTCGPLLAAGPSLLERMRIIADATERGSTAHKVADEALKELGETGEC
jgi:hypothetical protein